MKKYILFLLFSPLFVSAQGLSKNWYFPSDGTAYDVRDNAASREIELRFGDDKSNIYQLWYCSAPVAGDYTVAYRKATGKYTCSVRVTNKETRQSTYKDIYVYHYLGDITSCAYGAGKKKIKLVPLGTVKVTDWAKGTYDYAKKDPPKFVCHDQCLMTLEGAGRYVMHGPIDLDNDADGYHIFSGYVEYMQTDKRCTPNDASEGLKEPVEKTEEEKVPDEETCKAEGGAYGEINGKKVCLGLDNKDKCLSGQTPGYVNGKLVCLTPEGDQLPPKDDAKPPSGPASDAIGSADGKGSSDRGTGSGDGKGGSGGGSGGGTGKGEGEGDKDEGGTGPSFGDQPGLYEPRYKNGIKGVWEQKKGQLQNTGLGQLSRRLMPSVNSGTCPKWPLDMNFGRNMNFGTLNLAPPCMIWPILRAIVTVCALILAHRIVFRG